MPWGPLVAVGQGRKAELAIKRGNTNGRRQGFAGNTGAPPRGTTRDTHHGVHHRAGSRTGGDWRSSEGKALIDERIRQVEVGGETLYVPELLRVKGRVLLSMREPDLREAEICFKESLELSRRQGARGMGVREPQETSRSFWQSGEIRNGTDAIAAGLCRVQRRI